MDVIGRDVPAGASPVDIAESMETAGFDGIAMRSGAGMISIPPHTRNRIAAIAENEIVPTRTEPRAGFLAWSDGSGTLSASFSSRYRGSRRSASPLNIPGVEVKSGSRVLPAEPLT